jgi:hypothetical protein
MNPCKHCKCFLLYFKGNQRTLAWPGSKNQNLINNPDCKVTIFGDFFVNDVKLIQIRYK